MCIKAADFNKEGQFQKAKSWGEVALMCDFTAIGAMVFVLMGEILAGIIVVVMVVSH